MVKGLNIDSTLVGCVIQGTRDGLSMAEVEVDAVGASRFNSESRDLSVLVGLHGRCNGSMTLNLSKRTAIFLASKFIGEELTDLDEDTIDAICEIGNIVAGSFKMLLKETEYEFETISLPALIFGGNYNLYYFKNITTASVTFEIPEVSVVHVADKFFSTSISLLGHS